MRSIPIGIAAVALLAACQPTYGPMAEGRACRSLTHESERDACFGRLEARGYTNIRDQLGGRASEGTTIGTDSGSASASDSSGGSGAGGAGGGGGAGGAGGGGAGGAGGGGGGGGGGGAGGGGGGGAGGGGGGPGGGGGGIGGLF